MRCPHCGFELIYIKTKCPRCGKNTQEMNTTDKPQVNFEKTKDGFLFKFKVSFSSFKDLIKQIFHI
jgi:uncharacterized OB-fold protein